MKDILGILGLSSNTVAVIVGIIGFLVFIFKDVKSKEDNLPKFNFDSLQVSLSCYTDLHGYLLSIRESSLPANERNQIIIKIANCKKAPNQSPHLNRFFNEFISIQSVRTLDQCLPLLTTYIEELSEKQSEWVEKFSQQSITTHIAAFVKPLVYIAVYTTLFILFIWFTKTDMSTLHTITFASSVVGTFIIGVLLTDNFFKRFPLPVKILLWIMSLFSIILLSDQSAIVIYCVIAFQIIIFICSLFVLRRNRATH